ncbi:hypothetical protein WA026_023297 [Henosepilachna vigintioctopunctata]|uniref:Discoidin domain-containing protein n=1 Tax=Henosepilachna vigintioctopunctata TaxID=420089 RepID=A0AAW1TYX3_9CUCU
MSKIVEDEKAYESFNQDPTKNLQKQNNNLVKECKKRIHSIKQSIVRYSAPKGEIRDENINLEDISFDGIYEGAYVKNGLGQLIDGLYGDDDYQKQLQGENSGTRWVGWSNGTRGGEPVDLTFEFRGIREFHAVHLHCNNMFTRGVQVFSQAEILFSLDGERYQASSVHAMIPIDLTRESARNITIKLHGRPAKFMKLRLTFTNKWMLISEISFESGKHKHLIIN